MTDPTARARSTAVEKQGIGNKCFMDLSRILNIIKPTRVKGALSGAVSGISIDTRKPMGEDHLFWAVRGEHFNGNDFAEEALAKGVKGAGGEPQRSL